MDFSQLLTALMSPADAVRNQAEAVYAKAKEQPDEVRSDVCDATPAAR